MKISSILWLTLPYLAFSSCGHQSALNNKIVVAGILENTKAKEIDVFLDSEFTSIPIEEDGSFYVDFDAEDSETYFFRADRASFELYLSPGDSVFVFADSEDFKATFLLEGDHVAENTYLFDKSNFYFESRLWSLMALDKEQYFQKKGSYFDQQRESFEKLKVENEIDPDFLKVEEAYFEYEPLLFDLEYPRAHAYENKISEDVVDFPKDETKAALIQIDLDRADLLASRSYTSIVERIVNDEVKEILKQDTTLNENEAGREKAIYRVADSLLKNKFVKDHFLYNYISQNLAYKGPVSVKNSYDKFMDENESPKLEARLKSLNDKWEIIMPGKEVPDFSFINIEGDSVKLSDLRGDLVYIDIWATWCGPCIAEHPHWDKMKEEYKDQPISFLTVSIDDNLEPWEKMVKSKNMEGLQWLAENGWKSEIAQHFMVNAIPRFLLLDKEGKVIDPSAERPSGDIRTMIDNNL